MRRLSTRSVGFKAVLGAAASTALLGATVAGPAASAATNGAGTATADATVLNVDLRGITVIDVLKDVSRSSTDPTIGVPEAVVSLTPAAATGILKAATDPLPTFESRSRGTGTQTDGTAVSLPPAGLPQLGAVITGSVTPATLKAVVDQGGAKADLTNQLTNLVVGGAVLNAQSAGNQLTTHAASTETTSTRSTTLDSLTALDLGTLLEMLGIDLTQLPLDVVLNIVKNLDLPVTIDGVTDPLAGDDLAAFLEDVVTEVEATQDDIGILGVMSASAVGDLDCTATLSSDVCSSIPGLPSAPSGEPSLEELQTYLDSLVSVLEDTLGPILISLNDLSLLSVEDAGVTVSAVAKDAVKDSSATVSAKIGTINVAGQSIPGVDLLATADTLESTVNAINSALNSALAPITGTGLPSLTDVVKVSLFDRNTSVAKSNNYTEALAAITVLTVNVTPPAELEALIDGLAALTGVGELVTSLEGSLPSLPSVGGVAAGDALKQAANVQKLSSGAQAKVLSFTASANFTSSPGGPAGELPRTGGTTTALPILVAAVMAAAALGTRHYLRLAKVTSTSR